ncbi:MAG: hypothetical protein IJ389_01105 [Clostridia bacterium]|nr:hypothetical protein [Clostridia bacterium]
MLTAEIKNILSQIEDLKANAGAENILPQNSFYLADGKIVCFEREVGESRHPYDCDGLVVWARSSGNIEACESLFSIFKPNHFSDDPSISFFAGIPMESGDFYPISILGVNRQLFEPLAVERYCVFGLRSAYYVTDTEQATFVVRLHVSRDKHIHLALYAVNKIEEDISFYLSSYINAQLRYEETESFWHRMSKFGSRLDNGSVILRSDMDCMTINQARFGGTVTEEYHTVDRGDILGARGRTLTNAESLRTGEYKRCAKEATTTEIASMGDIFHYELKAGEEVRIEYDLSYYHNIPDAQAAASELVDIDDIDAEVAEWAVSEEAELANMTAKFDDWKGGINNKVLNRFIRNVQKQTSFCALGKNYAGPHIGIRDVFQQLEGSLIWQPEKSREKIVVALNYILEDGRPPRQFSVPADPDAIPDMDMRRYIDQGVWIISTIYTYLSYTDDWSILDELCSYYVAKEFGNSEHNYVERKSDIVDSVLCHMIKIMDYMARNIDREYDTHCLKILHGDWNDALDGLGRCFDEKDKRYGSGITVMATLQLYQNCREMIEILTKVGGYDDKIAEYKDIMEELAKGLTENAIDINEAGERKIIHGIGDKRSYKLGSWNDPDGVSRRSGTANAFWAISGMIERDVTLKDTIVDTIKALDSKYGLLTFDYPFPYGMKEAGRMANITAGTYENCCAYVHASMFSIMSLFILGASDEAWRQMEKSMVISHDNCTMTTFAMPNSYCCNPDYEIDGGSMGDWYTGSGAVLVKELIKYGFGIAPDLSGLKIQTPATMPCDSASIKINVKGNTVNLVYRNEGAGKRCFRVNGEAKNGTLNELMEVENLYIPTEELSDGMIIEIVD